MKSMLLILLLTGSFSAYANNRDSCNTANTIKGAVQSLIDKVHGDDPKTPYYVFVLRFYHLDEHLLDISFTLSFIINSYDFDEVTPSYYFKLGKDVILVQNDTSFVKELDSEQLKDLNFKRINDSDRSEIIKMLYPADHSKSILLHPCSLVFSTMACKTDIEYYDYFDDVPVDRMIYYKPILQKKLN